MDALDELWRHIRLCLVFGFRRRCVSLGFGLGLVSFGLIIPNLLLRLLPVLNCCTVVAGSLPVEFVGSLSDLWRQIGRCLGFRLWLGFSLRLRLVSFGLSRLWGGGLWWCWTP